MTDRPRIHFFGKTQKYASEASIGFACMALKLLELPGTFTIEFEHDLQTMYTKFLESNSEKMIVMPTNMDNIDFINDVLKWGHDTNVLVGRYMVPSLDWQTPDGIPRLRPSDLKDDPEVFAIRKYSDMPETLQEVLKETSLVVSSAPPASVLAKNTFLGCVGFRKKLR